MEEREREGREREGRRGRGKGERRGGRGREEGEVERRERSREDGLLPIQLCLISSSSSDRCTDFCQFQEDAGLKSTHQVNIGCRAAQIPRYTSQPHTAAIEIYSRIYD